MALALVVSVAAIIAFDAAAASVSKLTGIAYGNFWIGSLFVYVILGYVLTQRFGMGPKVFFILACTAVGDATLGWWISSLIGPGNPGSVSPALLIIGATGGIVFGVVTGTVGASIAFAVSRMRRS